MCRSILPMADMPNLLSAVQRVFSLIIERDSGSNICPAGCSVLPVLGREMGKSADCLLPLFLLGTHFLQIQFIALKKKKADVLVFVMAKNRVSCRDLERNIDLKILDDGL